MPELCLLYPFFWRYPMKKLILAFFAALMLLLLALGLMLVRVRTNIWADLSALNLPSVFYNMLPYVISLVVLAFTSRKSQGPKAAGVPYDKGTR